MEQDPDNIEKKEYHPPILIEYGTLDSITQYKKGPPVDGAAPGTAPGSQSSPL